MRPPVPAEQWAALRALREGEEPTYVRLAAAARLNFTTIAHRASQQGWKKRERKRVGVRSGPLAEASWARPRGAGSAAAADAGFAAVRPAGLSEAAQAGMAAAGQAGLFGPARLSLGADAGSFGPARLLAEAEAGLHRPSRLLAAEDAGTASERMARVREFLMRQIEAIAAEAEQNAGILDKGQADGMAAILRLAERIESADARADAQEIIQQKTRSDEELADVLQRIDDRIVELARAYAAEIVAGRLQL